MNKNKVILNVGGKRFETLESTLRRIPNTMLGRIDQSSPYYDEGKEEYFFDRDPFLFTSILNLYRIGELHLPHNICGPAIKRELLFWEVDENIISECCWRFYKAFEEEQGRLVRIRHAFGFNKSEYSPTRGTLDHGLRSNRFLYWKQFTWRLLSEPTSTLAAKIWATIFFLLLILSCTVQILRTEPELRSSKYDNSTDRILRLFNSGSEVNSTPAYVLRVLEDILTIFFTIELSLRFSVCPEKRRFVKDALNWIDAICVIPMLVIFIVRIIMNVQSSTGALAYVSAYMSITGLLRVLRLLKLIQHVIGFKILILTLKASMKEILLLMGLISLCTVLFAVSIYIVEIFDESSDFPSISDGLWWAIITMTTVGYGDLKPITFAGRVVGALCAMSGILTTGLAIPVIASNFDKFYSDAQVLKQSRLTESRPKSSEMRKRVKDPFSLGAYPAIEDEKPPVSNGDANHSKTVVPSIEVQASVVDDDTSDALVVANEAALTDLKLPMSTTNGHLAAIVPAKRRFSLGAFNNNSVAPLAHQPSDSATTPINPQMHKSQSTFLSMDSSRPVARQDVNWREEVTL